MKAYILVGNIASGKSTWAKKKGLSVMSRDTARYQIGNGDYLYDSKLEHFVTLMCNALLYSFISLKKDIVIDCTSPTVASRRDYIALLKANGYEVIAMIFPDRGCIVHVEDRLANNHGSTTREKWEDIYWNFVQTYERPMPEDGFNEVRYITNFKPEPKTCKTCRGRKYLIAPDDVADKCYHCNGTGLEP